MDSIAAQRERDPALVVDLDHHSAEHAHDPAAAFERARGKCPVGWTTAHGGYWVAASYNSVFEIVRDPETFETTLDDEGRSPISLPPAARAITLVPIEIGPPEFRDYRRLLDPYLSPRAVRAMADGIAYYARFFVDRIIEKGEIEVLTELAFPTPATITFDWLGLPLDNWQIYAKTLHDVLHTPGDAPEAAAVYEAHAQLLGVISEELESRRSAPRNDVLTAIAAHPLAGGEPMTHERALGTASLVITGGLSTTALLLTHALIELEGQTEVHARLLEDDRFLHTATEELLRYASPITSEGRRVACDLEFEGAPLSAGDLVLISWIGANRDPAAFEEPNTLKLDRWPNRHLAFGGGPHRCIGSNLGRAMFKAMIREVLARMPDYRITEVVPGPNRGTDNSFERVGLAFTPGAREGTEATPTRQFDSAPEGA